MESQEELLDKLKRELTVKFGEEYADYFEEIFFEIWDAATFEVSEGNHYIEENDFSTEENEVL